MVSHSDRNAFYDRANDPETLIRVLRKQWTQLRFSTSAKEGMTSTRPGSSFLSLHEQPRAGTIIGKPLILSYSKNRTERITFIFSPSFSQK